MTNYEGGLVLWEKSEWNLETIAVQGGYDPKKGEARVMPQ